MAKKGFRKPSGRENQESSFPKQRQYRLPLVVWVRLVCSTQNSSLVIVLAAQSYTCSVNVMNVTFEQALVRKPWPDQQRLAALMTASVVLDRSVDLSACPKVFVPTPIPTNLDAVKHTTCQEHAAVFGDMSFRPLNSNEPPMKI